MGSGDIIFFTDRLKQNLLLWKKNKKTRRRDNNTKARVKNTTKYQIKILVSAILWVFFLLLGEGLITKAASESELTSLKSSEDTKQGSYESYIDNGDKDGEISGITETAYITGKNLFDPVYLLGVKGWTESDNVYSGALNSLVVQYGTNGESYPVHVRFKEKQRYTFSCKGYTANEQSGEALGFLVIFRYTDGSESKKGIGNAENAFVDFSFTSDTNKTISGMYFSYGSKPQNIWFLKDIQLEEGAYVTKYTSFTETPFEAVKPDAIQDASIGKEKLSFDPNEGFQTNAFPEMFFEIALPVSDMAFIEKELYAFTSSSDDHSTYAGIQRIFLDYDNRTYHSDLLYHNWGHINSIDYSQGADALIFSNAGQSTTDEGIIYIINNASTIKSLRAGSYIPFECVMQIDCSGLGLGYKFQLCWGESNNGRYDIAYLLTSDMKKIRRIQLGKGENEFSYGTMIQDVPEDNFNGTFEVLGEFETNIQMQNNGIEFYGGHIYAVGDHTAKHILKFTIDTDGDVRTDTYSEICRDASGEMLKVYGEGIAFDHGYMAFGSGDRIGIYESIP